jgi:MATE family multidrug resistance protein
MSWAGIPIGLWLAFRCDLGLHGLWHGLTVSLVYGSAVGVWLGLNTDWNREVQKVQKRLQADKANWDAQRRRSGEGESAGV